ncbi:transposase, IS200 family [Psychroflexus torquis ATCC 700755]|jgi:REP element-mobilizing transposase RayT|uniref:Transposase, IS200 family n=1 Tax=Psychroflexus torquis (strain ATCC 700755 / CIP 106069 / ACAM 623) TaxID=313595 RepID=K4INB9_PSYTT|nr:IS200/IS605 family transposase [Psychroflexus torquis]AFU70511.1 transposase, IS200 family [Psychroflexus torquis ATCC 700755]
MANTYTQLYFHIVFAVKGRNNLIAVRWKDELYKYITGIISNKNQKLMIINGMPNHVHLLIGTKPNCNLSDLVRDIKANSSKWINEKQFVNGKFEWQTGFGAFTVSQSAVNNVLDYIKNQEEHHQVKTFKEEYIGFLKSYNIEYKTEYLFTDD